MLLLLVCSGRFWVGRRRGKADGVWGRRHAAARAKADMAMSGTPEVQELLVRS